MIKHKIEYKNKDGKFSLCIYPKELSKIIDLCKESKTKETGGRLIGFYTSAYSRAVITNVVEPAEDTKSGTTWLDLGIQGLKELFEYFWTRRKTYYIGDWHFHPYSSPSPSSTDISQLKEISASKKYNCPEPILIIIGGDPNTKWSSKVFIYENKNGLIELKQ